jgi:Fe-S cluster biogenesis protein NfuA/Fe-S cluster assembly iron-binding protein IscA
MTATAIGTTGERAAGGSPPGAAPLLRTGERSTVRVDLTPRASRQIRSLLAAREPESYGLRLTVDESAATAATSGTAYLLSLAPVPHGGDLVLARNGFEVFVPQRHATRLDGVRIDFVESSTTAGFLIDPPARPPRPRRPGGSPQAADGGPAAGGGGAVPGAPEVVAAVQEAIAQVRPALQADGGDLALVAIDGGVALVELVGACSACSSALVTLTELVERVIVAAVPAIERVVLA